MICVNMLIMALCIQHGCATRLVRGVTRKQVSRVPTFTGTKTDLAISILGLWGLPLLLYDEYRIRERE